jgi:hypothetical protein
LDRAQYTLNPVISTDRKILTTSEGVRVSSSMRGAASFVEMAEG